MDVARRLRAADDVPILMLTARDALESRVEGLDAGADDYLVKPFERQELLARLRALLRRRPPRGSASLVVADLSLNPDTHEVRRGDRVVELTQREFELLVYLMRNERIVVPRQRLLEDVWGYDPFATTNTIEVFVSNLRRKLEGGGEARLLHTARGAGYVLRACGRSLQPRMVDRRGGTFDELGPPRDDAALAPGVAVGGPDVPGAVRVRAVHRPVGRVADPRGLPPRDVAGDGQP